MILASIQRAKSFSELLALFDGASQKGRDSFVVTAKGDEVQTAFKLVEADQLIPSNTPDGKINPAFPEELQPRDRTRKASIMQIDKMAGNLRPAQLTDSGLSSHGAPIVGPDLVVESGNGRTMAILKAYSTSKGDDYRQYLIDNAQRFGFDSDVVKGMDKPVLVRERLTEMDRATFARDSNLSDLQQMSASETAWVDAEVMDDKMMALLSPSESGSLLARSNDGFVQSFMRALGDTSAAGLVTSDGRPTRQLLDRMQNAIFAKAYKNDRLVKLVAEEPDPEIRNILNALNSSASQFVEMQYLDGVVHKSVSDGIVSGVESQDESLADKALNSLVSATELVRQAKDSGQDINELIAQSGLFGDNDPEVEALARFISANNRSAKRMAEAFKELANVINEQLRKDGSAIGDMFGGGEVTLIEVLSQVGQRLEEQQTGQGGFMFESARIDELANKAATSPQNDLPEPTQEQLENNDYQTGSLRFAGLPVEIENPKGSDRKGTDANGVEWRTRMNHHYGYIYGSQGADGDEVDVFLGENEKPKYAYVINQVDPDSGAFDEHKVMLGFHSPSEAKQAYLSNYSDDWSGLGAVVPMLMADFMEWIYSPAAALPAKRGKIS
jgi:hypothetical protein